MSARQTPQASPVLDAPCRAFDTAAARSPTGIREAWLRFAGLPVRMRIAGELLAEHMIAAFEHLLDPVAAADQPPALSIDMWDRVTTGVGCPGVPFIPETTRYLDAGLLTDYERGTVVRYERPQSVTCLDRPAGRILSCRRDARELALYERSKPFPEMLTAWYHDRGVLQLHAGLVSRGGEGVLFVGKSGSGKSTCTLACALNGYDFLGDDFVGLTLDNHGACWGHSFYSGARVDEGHLRRFPQLVPHVIPPACEWDLKSMVLMPRVIPQRMAAKTRIRAVVRPRIAGQGPTRFTKTSRVQTLLSLTPSTLSVPLSSGASGFLSLMDFMPRVSCFDLDLGTDHEAIPGSVNKILDQALAG